jgi:hypothetical protein
MPEERLGIRVPQILQIDPEMHTVWKLIILSHALEVGKNLEAMAHIANDDEWRPTMILRKIPRIALGLFTGIEHQHVPGLVR